MAPTIAFVTKKGIVHYFFSHIFDHQSKFIYSYKVFTFIIEIMKHIHKKKKTKSFAIVPKQRKIETAAKEGRDTNPRKFQHALYIIISRFTATRPRHCVHTLQPRFYVSTILQ